MKLLIGYLYHIYKVWGTTTECIFESVEDQMGVLSKNQKGPYRSAPVF